MLLGLTNFAFSQSELSVFPKRAIFDNNDKRSQIFTLTNASDKVLKYEMSFINFKMDENGGFKKIDSTEEGLNFASDFLRFYPRNVVLNPKESQVVKVSFRKRSDMKIGEYRSHFYIRSVPLNNIVSKKIEEKSSGIAINLEPAFGFSLPLIVRVGKLEPLAKIVNINYERKNDSLSEINFQIKRNGLSSVYGNIEVNYINAKKKKILLGKLQGIAVYTPLEKRFCNIILMHDNKEVDLKNGKILITYTSLESKTRDQIISEEFYSE